MAKPWNRADDHDLQELLDEGLTHRVIAERMGRSQNSVSARIADLDLRSGGAEARHARAHHLRLVSVWQALVTGQRMEATS